MLDTPKSPPEVAAWVPVLLSFAALAANMVRDWSRMRQSGATSQDQRYRRQVDGVIAALERRMSLAEEAEADCLKERERDRERIQTCEDTIDRLARRLARINGINDNGGTP